jgi:Contractile injection system tube protein
MTSFPNSPLLLKGGIVLIDAATSAVRRVIGLQYNPDSITRTLQVQAAGPEGDRLEAFRLKGPPNETIKLDAEIDATDQLEHPDQNPNATQLGIYPQLAALETIVYPRSTDLQMNNTLAQLGTIEIAPAEAPLTLFVWSKTRILPVRITEFSITEEAFDPNLNPIRAKISLGLRVLSVNDLGFNHRGGNLFMAYLQAKEQLAQRNAGGALSTLGISGIP